jgi:hypothetical protein
MDAKLIQLTNSTIGVVGVDGFMPLGTVTTIYPSYSSYQSGSPIYVITSSTSDTLQINRSGTYKVIYSASVVATAAGDVTVDLLVNGVSKYSVTETAAEAGTVNITIPFEVYIPGNCCASPINIPAYVQL